MVNKHHAVFCPSRSLSTYPPFRIGLAAIASFIGDAEEVRSLSIRISHPVLTSGGKRYHVPAYLCLCTWNLFHVNVRHSGQGIDVFARSHKVKGDRTTSSESELYHSQGHPVRSSERELAHLGSLC